MNDMERLCLLGGIMARGEVPVRVEAAVRLGRMTALQKPDGGIRGIVVGDVLRRLIARTMAQQIADAVEAATAPFQYALKSKGGCECVAHILQAVTDMDERATIVSVDGLGAFDLVSRKATLQGLMAEEGGPQLLPFVRILWAAISFLVGGRSWRCTRSTRAKVENRWIPLCPCCSALRSMPPSQQLTRDSTKVNTCLLPTTISTRYAFPSKLANSTVSSPMSWLPKHILLCTMGRPRCGIVEGMSLQRALLCKPRQGCRTKTPLFGEATTPCPMRCKGSKFWGRQWAKLSLFGTTWFRRLQTRCVVLPYSRDSGPAGSVASPRIVPQRSLIFSSGQWHLISQRSMHLHMTTQFGCVAQHFGAVGLTA